MSDSPTGGTGSRRRRIRVLAGVTAFLALWAVLALWIVPVAIRSAYEGTGPGILNGVITGQSRHPVESYLAYWSRIARLLTYGLFSVLLLIGLTWRFRVLLGRFLRPLTVRLFPPGPDPAKPLDLVAIAVSSGVVFGLLEWLVVLGRRALTDWVGEHYSSDLFWMAPAASGAVFLLLGVLVAAIAAGFRGRDFRPVTVFLCVAIGFRGLIATGFGATIHPAAALLLALGLAWQTARRSGPRLARQGSRIRRAALALGVGVVVLGVGRPVVLKAGERFHLRRMPAAPAGAPNVLLIVLDVVRSVDMSLYGYERPTTPFLERWALGGVTFDRAIAPSPWTLPSHAALFSGIVHRPASWQSPVRWRGPVLAGALDRLGYATGGFMANLYYGGEYFGLQRGFAHYESFPRDLNVLLQSAWVTRRLSRRVRNRRDTGPRRPIYKTAGDVNDDLLDWLDGSGRDSRRPFFAFLNYIDAHEPYTPPAPFDHRFAGAGAAVGLAAPGHSYDAAEVADLRASYDGSIAYEDSELERLFGQLEERGLLDNTLVIVTADHGEEFLEHGVMGHSHSLFFPALHVPLVIRQPGHVPEGVRIGETVGLTDIPATIFDLIGAAASAPFPGQSLTPLWGDDPAGRPPGTIYSETIAKPYGLPESYPNAQGGIQSVVWTRWHYIRYVDGHEQLFDVVNDPFEERDQARAPEMRDLLAGLRAKLEASQPDALPGSAERPGRR
ncbi:MAG: sulfatase [Gemmatimonadota bacterium]|jgi:arylsulfatase A-like enzyme